MKRGAPFFENFLAEHECLPKNTLRFSTPEPDQVYCQPAGSRRKVAYEEIKYVAHNP